MMASGLQNRTSDLFLVRAAYQTKGGLRRLAVYEHALLSRCELPPGGVDVIRIRSLDAMQTLPLGMEVKGDAFAMNPGYRRYHDIGLEVFH